MAQDDYYYEIQLTNKQLVFYFMAGATGLILSFLAGVMVGRGVDAKETEVQSARVQEEKVVTEEPLVVRSSPRAGELTFAQRLESEKPEETLERAKGTKTPAAPPSTQGAHAAASSPAEEGEPLVAPLHLPSPSPVAVKSPSPRTAVATVSSPRPSSPTATAKASPPPKPTEPATGTFAIQVGAFKDKVAADAMVGRLKKKGFPAFVADGGAGLFNVRVGPYSARPDADKVQARLREDEKLQPFVVRK